jgi:hypothetical protein
MRIIEKSKSTRSKDLPNKTKQKFHMNNSKKMNKILTHLELREERGETGTAHGDRKSVIEAFLFQNKNPPECSLDEMRYQCFLHLHPPHYYALRNATECLSLMLILTRCATFISFFNIFFGDKINFFEKENKDICMVSKSALHFIAHYFLSRPVLKKICNMDRRSFVIILNMFKKNSLLMYYIYLF